jgi:glycosyltransferase involved in cell wall biosynthesis
VKICHLIYDDINNPYLGGGGAVRAWEIYRRLATRHEITLVTGNFPGANVEEWREGVRFLRVGSASGYARSRLSYSRHAIGCLKQLEWDVWVHEFSAFAPLRVPAALRRLGVLFFYHFVGAHALKKHPLIGALAWAAEVWTLRAYKRIVTISPSMQEQVQAKLAGRPVQVEQVYTGVDDGYFSLTPEEAPYILYFGRMDIHTKGLDVLLEAFAAVAPTHPAIRLKMAGRGTPKAKRHLAALVRGVGLTDRVELLGGVDENTKNELLRRALFVCMPSRYEGWGIVAVEAQAAGKAVLGTRVSGLVDAIQDGESGLLVASGQAIELAAGMRRLLGDMDLRQKLGAAGRKWARRFDWARVAEDQEEMLRASAVDNGRLS